MRRRLSLISFGLLMAGLAGCDLLNGTSSGSVVPLPRGSATDEEASPIAEKAQPAAKENQPPNTVTPKRAIPTHISESQRRMLTINKLRRIGQALDSYQTAHEQHPDQSVGGLSWRVALLPFFGEVALYRSFRLNEPWDSEHNLALVQQIPEVYQSVERPVDGKTNFLLVTGPGTACPNRVGLSVARCPDGLHNTVLLIEGAEHLARPWTQPEDYVFERATCQQDLFGLRLDCCLVLLGNSREVRRLPASISDRDLLAVLSPSGREAVLARAVTKDAAPEPDTQLIAALERQPPKRFPAPAASPTPAGKTDTAATTGSDSSGAAKVTPTPKPQPPPTDLRLSVPDDKTLAAAAATAKDLYKTDYEAAKKPAEKRALARKLLDLANKVAGDPPGMFVLLRDARDLGAPAGDLDTALAAADKLGQTFRLDSLPLKLKSLEQAAPAVEGMAEAGKLFTKSLELENALLERDDFDGAKRALAVALSAARRANNREPVDRVNARREKLDELKRGFDRVSGALLTLVRNPDDPAANAAVGRYLCLMRENWTRGLPLLARGDDQPFRELAVIELSQPASADDQAALADRWWAWSETLSSPQPGSLERRAARRRAAHWYKQALDRLPASLVAERARRRIAEADEEGGSAKPAKNPVKNTKRGR